MCAVTSSTKQTFKVSTAAPTELYEPLSKWLRYLELIDWRSILHKIKPITTPNGLIYELGKQLGLPGTLALCDMSSIEYAPPHYHGEPETEVYVALEGSGTFVAGYAEYQLEKGMVIPVPPNTAHFTIPDDQLILALITFPAFNPNNLILTGERSDQTVCFDYNQFLRLIEKRKKNSKKPS